VPIEPQIDVSIIIPAFNRLWCLPKAVASCRDSAVSIEIIVIDDGSSDGTWEWLCEQKDVTALRQENWGKGWAVNRAFAQSRGEYVRFLDSDDWLLPGANAKQVALARSKDVDIVVAGYEVRDEREQLIKEQAWIECDDFIAQQLGECDSSHYSAYLFRRSFLVSIPHREEFSPRDDRAFVLEAALGMPRVAVCSEPVFAQRHHSQDRLQFPKGMRAVATNLRHLMLYRKILGRLQSDGDLTPRRKRAACKILWPLAHWIAYSHPDEGQEVADWVFQLDPQFCIPESGALGVLYRRIGFRRTERLLHFRRSFLGLFRPRRLRKA
jgi:glycosyltransferase involved in cell wall biosynthesis